MHYATLTMLMEILFFFLLLFGKVALVLTVILKLGISIHILFCSAHGGAVTLSIVHFLISVSTVYFNNDYIELRKNAFSSNLNFVNSLFSFTFLFQINLICHCWEVKSLQNDYTNVYKNTYLKEKRRCQLLKKLKHVSQP